MFSFFNSFYNFICNFFVRKIFIGWVGTTNHKRVGIMYLLFGIFTGFLSILFSLVIRLQLAYPGSVILGDNYQFYNVMVTMHGILMLFFVIMPILLGGFGNFFIPLLIGAPDMAFPRLNNLSF
jgi:heme/copper-type cytochrome/quinol oxidase subunit 1